MLKILLLIICFFTLNLNAQTQKFSLTGKTSKIEDGNYLYLRDLVTGEQLDSTLVENNRFLLTTDLPESMIFAMLFTKDKKNFKELWLENNTMTFDASKTSFNDALITGSENQDLAGKINEVHENILELPADTIDKRETNFIKKYPNSLVSAYFIYGNRSMTQQEIRDLFLSLSNDVQKTSLGKKIAKKLENDMPEIGETYRDFKISNEENVIQNISDLTGELTLIQFWSSSCGFSRQMNSTLKKVYDNNHSKGFNIISISSDKIKDNWITAIKEDKMTWPQLSNLNGWKGEVFEAYGISSTPSNILIDENGIIIGKNIMAKELENQVVEFLK